MQLVTALAAPLLGLGAAMLGGLAGSTPVANWYVRRRGTALGIAAPARARGPLLDCRSPHPL